MAAQTTPANGAQRRLWGVRLVVLAATAAALGVSQQQLSESQAGMAGLADSQNISLERVRSVALAAAEPLLDEAVRAGAISEVQIQFAESDAIDIPHQHRS